jgi:uncharacterized membrane protein HdeD (DUF308 family)
VVCIPGAIVGKNALTFCLSVGNLLFFNGLIYLVGSLRARKYAPGMISGLLLFILLGVAYQIVSIGYLGLASLLKRA